MVEAGESRDKDLFGGFISELSIYRHTSLNKLRVYLVRFITDNLTYWKPPDIGLPRIEGLPIVR